MLEEMREAGAAGTLARGADVVPHVHADDRHAVILVQDHGEAVAKRELRIGDLEPRRSGRFFSGVRRRRLRERRRSGEQENQDASRHLLLHQSHLTTNRAKETKGRIITAVTDERPLVGVIMGSKSDWDTMKHAAEVLAAFDVPHEARIVSAHRTPSKMAEYAASAAGRGLEV